MAPRSRPSGLGDFGGAEAQGWSRRDLGPTWALRQRKEELLIRRNRSQPGTNAVSRDEACFVDWFLSICAPRGSTDLERIHGLRITVPRPPLCLRHFFRLYLGQRGAQTRERTYTQDLCPHGRKAGKLGLTDIHDVKQNMSLRNSPGVHWALGAGRRHCSP